MAFCHSCGKEIAGTAFCPYCGASQSGVAGGKRDVGKLIGFGVVWTIVFWFGALFIAGMIAGVASPDNAGEAGRAVGHRFSGIFFLISLVLSILLTVVGVLPGTQKRAAR